MLHLSVSTLNLHVLLYSRSHDTLYLAHLRKKLLNNLFLYLGHDYYLKNFSKFTIIQSILYFLSRI